jgi:hypothetical protein
MLGEGVDRSTAQRGRGQHRPDDPVDQDLVVQRLAVGEVVDEDGGRGQEGQAEEERRAYGQLPRRGGAAGGEEGGERADRGKLAAQAARRLSARRGGETLSRAADGWV